MRASIHMNFDPIFTAEAAMERSAKWYEKNYFKYLESKKVK